MSWLVRSPDAALEEALDLDTTALSFCLPAVGMACSSLRLRLFHGPADVNRWYKFEPMQVDCWHRAVTGLGQLSSVNLSSMSPDDRTRRVNAECSMHVPHLVRRGVEHLWI